jgi:hypothetical protein
MRNIQEVVLSLAGQVGLNLPALIVVIDTSSRDA